MSKLALRVVGLGVVIGLLGIGSYAIAGGSTRNFSGAPLNGYEENPDISTVATGSFEARLSKDGTSIHYKLSYSGLEGDVLQSHVHFGKAAVNGGISFFLCANGNVPAPAPAGTPSCQGPKSGTIEDDIVAADVIGPTGQGIEAANLPEILAAMRAGHAYVNVHSTKWPSGEIRAQIDDHGQRGRGGDGDGGDDD